MASGTFFKFTFAIFTLCTALGFVSCSDAEPELSEAEGFILLNFTESKKAAEPTLAVFAETTSEVRRVKSLTIKSRLTKYEWTCENPVVFSDSKKQWAGCIDFAVPKGTQIPNGLYDLVYTDAQGRSVESVFSISYEKDFIEQDAETVLKQISESGTKYIAVYNSKKTVIYFGPRKMEWGTDEKLFASLNEAFYYRQCIVKADKSAMCIMPAVYKKDIGNL